MRNVLPTDQIAHLWAHKAQDSARNPQHNFYFTGPTLYSYGAHYVVAFHMPDDYGDHIVLRNARGYSVVTSKHQSFARRSIPRSWTVIDVDGLSENDTREIERSGAHTVRASLVASMRDALAAAAKPRIRDATRQGHIASAAQYARDAGVLATVDAKRKDSAKVRRDEARAMLRALPTPEAFDAAQQSKELTLALAAVQSRGELLEKLSAVRAYVAGQENDLAGARDMLAQFDASTDRTSGGWNNYGPAAHVARRYANTVNAMRSVADACKAVGKKPTPAERKRLAELLAEHDSIRDAKAREGRDDSMRAYAEALALARERPDVSRQRDNADRVRVELETLDTPAERALRVAEIAALDAARADALAATAWERSEPVAESGERALLNGNYSFAMERARELQQIASQAHAPIAAAIASQADTMRLRALAATAEAREQAVSDWRAGRIRTLPYGLVIEPGALLRLSGNVIKTSQGASVPADVAPLLWRLVRDKTAREFADGTGPRLGHYRLDRITADGDIHAGCHVIRFAELERFARELELTP